MDYQSSSRKSREVFLLEARIAVTWSKLRRLSRQLLIAPDVSSRDVRGGESLLHWDGDGLDYADVNGWAELIERPETASDPHWLGGTPDLGRFLTSALRFRAAVSKRDLEDAVAQWDLVLSHSSRFTYLLSQDLEDDISEALEDLELCTPAPLLITPPNRVIETPSLIIGISGELARRISSDPSVLYELDPHRFEEFMAEVFAGFGYGVELTARTRDGGRDIIAIRHQDDLVTKLLIECKRYAAHRRVGVGHVRELYAVKLLEGATKAVLATTSFFTRDARALERRLIYELELKDYYAVVQWARSYSSLLGGLTQGSSA